MNNLKKIHDLDNLQCGEFSRALHKIVINNTTDIDEILEYAKISPIEALIEKEEKLKIESNKEKRIILMVLILSGLVHIWKYFFN